VSLAAHHQGAGLHIPGLHPHELRHTASGLVITSGADVKVVLQMLGHTTATTTLDLYGHVDPDRLDEFAERLDAAVRAAVAPVLPTAEIVDLDETPKVHGPVSTVRPTV
jgi:site-specific recombinase XerC